MSESRLFVGNLAFQTMENDLQDYFSQAGIISSVNLMLDKFTGKSRGFAFVEYASSEEANKAVAILGLGPEVASALQQFPSKGSLDQTVPVDPLIYRFYEITQVYGTTIKALIHEMFGDGIMSAIDFEMDIARKEDPKGDRVVITMNGKFLPYKKW